MKRLYFYLSTLFCIFALGLSMSACSEEDELGANEGLSIKVYSPTKVIPGQEVVISGTGLDFATSVVFPGEVTTSDIEVINAGMIKVTTPAGIDANGGELVVNTETETATARVPMTVGNPNIGIMNPTDKANVGDEITITGTDMEFFTKAYFPGEEGEDVVVNAIDFNRKSTSQLRLSVPRGIAEGMAAIRLETCDGKQYTLPEIELSATVPGYWETQEIILWEGEEDLGTWSNNWSVKAAWFAGVEVGTEITFHFEIYADFAQFKTETGEWGAITIPEWGNQTVTTEDLLAGGVTSLSFKLTEDLMNPWFTTGDSWGNGDAIIIHGEGMKFTKISYTKEVFIEGDGGGPVTETVWEGDKEITWGDDGKVILPYEFFENAEVGSTLTLYYDQIADTWAQAQFNYANWTSFVFSEFGAGASAMVPTDMYDWEFASRETQLVLTQEILDNIHANHGDVFGVDAGIIIQGSGLIFKKVTITSVWVDPNAEKVVWEGEEDMNGWGNNWSLKVAWFEGAQVGSEITLHYEIYADFAQFKTETGEWGELIISEWGNQTLTTGDILADNPTSLSFKLTDELLNPWFTTGDSWGNGDAMIIHGEGMKFTKITMK